MRPRALLSSEGWRAWLRARATLHSYSLHNTLLIAQEAGRRGFVPTHVAGFKAWLRLGRCVRKGERGTPSSPRSGSRTATDDGEQTGDARLFFRTVHVWGTLSRDSLGARRGGGVGRSRGGVTVRAEPRPQPLEIGEPVVGEADELAIEDHAPPPKRLREPAKLRELAGAVAARAGAHAEGPPVPPQLRPHPVELHSDAHLELDFRVGGREHSRGTAPDGRAYRYEALYQDIVPDQRIVYTYDMLLHETRISVSLATVEFRSEGDGDTRLAFTEQVAFLDGHESPARRAEGMGGLLDALGEELQGDCPGG